MFKVIIESPFRGDINKNVKYAQKCMLDSLKRGEAPFLSHLLYPLVLEDSNEKERYIGIIAGLEWGRVADLRAVYIDYGITSGMKKGVRDAKIIHQPIEYRRILNNEEI